MNPVKKKTWARRIGFLALSLTAVSGTFVRAQSGTAEPKAVSLPACSSAPAKPPAPAANDRNAKILAQVSACLAADTCQVILIDKDKSKPLVDLRKSSGQDMGYDVWEKFVAAP